MSKDRIVLYSRPASFIGYGDYTEYIGPGEQFIDEVPELVHEVMQRLFKAAKENNVAPDLQTVTVIIKTPSSEIKEPDGSVTMHGKYTVGVRFEAHKKQGNDPE